MNYKNKETKRIEKLKKVDELLSLSYEDISTYTEEDINELMTKFTSVIGMCNAYHGVMMNKGNVTLMMNYKQYIKMLKTKRRTVLRWYEDNNISKEILSYV